jgi:predicted ATP-grasp superfamily ATP-dependent carboligase
MAHDKAQEALILGRWLMAESGGPQPGFTRLVRKLAKMKGQDGFERLMMVLRDEAEIAAGVLSAQQGDALDEVKYIYKL